MIDVIKDIDNLLKKIKESTEEKRYFSYVERRRNVAFVQCFERTEIIKRKENLIKKQNDFEKDLEKELMLFDSLNVPIIGLKGYFIKSEYYGSIPRIYNDIDLFVQSSNSAELYKGLKSLGYHINYKTLYDNPVISMNICPKYYMENTQTLMLINSKKNISIDMHSNINITNVHFVHSNTVFNTDELFENSHKFNCFRNIRTLDLHDNLCFLFRHLLKHHVFYGKTQSGLQTPIQHVLDLALIINSELFCEDVLYNKAVKYNIVPEAIFCLNLYNKIFVSGKKIDLKLYLQQLVKLNYDFKWKPILMASLNMPIENLMIGNFQNEFPKLQNIINKSQSLPQYWMNSVFQKFVVSFTVKYLLK